MKKHILLPLSLLLASCLAGPNFLGAKGPGMPVTWVNAMPPCTGKEDMKRWWNEFHDPQLNALIDTGLRNNPDMATGALAIARAESQVRASGANLAPSASISFGGSNSGSYSTSTSHGRWNGGLSASWSPDIWGGDRRAVEAAAASLGSTKAAAAATQTALASSIATTYFEWISAQESLRVAKEQLKIQEHTFDIIRRKVEVGSKNNLDLAEAEVNVRSTRAQIPTYEANIKLCENTLATLLGTTVDQIHLAMPAEHTFNRIPTVPTGLPADLLRRRPDIVRAEYELHNATANIGVAVANLFPRISLTGNTSAASRSDFAHFFSTAGWSLAGSASQTIFNRTQLRESVKVAKIAEQTAGQNYRKTVLAAFAEVEAALINYAKLTNQLPQYEASARASRTAAELAERQYNAGQTDFLNLSSAQRSLLSSELNVISTRQQIRVYLAKLYTALGGGW